MCSKKIVRCPACGGTFVWECEHAKENQEKTHYRCFDCHHVFLVNLSKNGTDSKE